MTLILQFLNVEKNYMEYVEISNVPMSSLNLFLREIDFASFMSWIFWLLDKDFPCSDYILYGVLNGHRSRRKLLCSYDFMDWAQASSTD